MPADNVVSGPELPKTSTEILSALLKHRRLVLLTPIVAALALVAVTLLQPRTYTTVASFVPQAPAGSRVSGLSSIAAQFGLGNISGSGAFGSPDLYKEILETREILGEIADDTFTLPRRETTARSLAEYWHLRAATYARVRELVIRRLTHAMDVKVDPRTQLVTLSVTTTSPELSRWIAQRSLELVDKFNQQKRQSQSAQEARFVAGRLEEARGQLRDAEDAIAHFVARNRDFRNAPMLQAQFDRLQREVSLRQAVYTTLAQGYEQARIEEVRDTPVITVVQQPVAPPMPDSRLLVLKLGLVLILGCALGAIIAVMRENGALDLMEGPRAADVQRQLVELRSELRHPWRLLGFGSREVVH